MAYFVSQVPTFVKLFLLNPSFFLSSSPGHLLVNDCSTVMAKLAVNFDEISHMYLWVNGGGLIEKHLTFMDDLNI